MLHDTLMASTLPKAYHTNQYTIWKTFPQNPKVGEYLRKDQGELLTFLTSDIFALTSA